MKKFLFSEFPINGAEVDEYCMSLAERYGYNSEVFKAAKEECMKDVKGTKTWCDFLNTVRERLIARGFLHEVERIDSEFEREMRKKLSEVNKYSGKTVRETRIKRTNEH